MRLRPDIILTVDGVEKGRIGDDSAVFVIAEIGQNHQGDFDLAKKLIGVAKHAGADCVKFQKTHLSAKFTQLALDRSYNSAHAWGPTYGAHKRHLEFNDAQFLALAAHARSVNILFSASAMDEQSLDLFLQFKAPFIKIGSGDTNNYPLIEKAARMRLPIVLSTGMQKLATVDRALAIIREHHEQVVVMHCVSAYPTQLSDVNMRTMHMFRERYPSLHVGYSGHEIGSVAHLAVAAGAKIIERHLTLDKSMKGSDHCCSLEPEEFAAMVRDVRQTEIAMGVQGQQRYGEKEILRCEIPCRAKLGKVLVAAKKLAKGRVLCKEDIAVKVSADGAVADQEDGAIPADRFFYLIGKELSTELAPDDIFLTKYLK